MCYSQIWQNFEVDKYLCKLGKEYSNASLCKFVIYSLQHSETFDVLHFLLQLTVAELSTLKQVRFFWPTLYIKVASNDELVRCSTFYICMSVVMSSPNKK